MYPDDSGSGQYGSFPDPMGNYAKPDDNVCVPRDVPITSIVSGYVTDVSWGKPWSGSVTVQLDNPPNDFAKYAAYNFLTRATVTPGQRINVGTMIGYPGQNVCLAFGLSNATPWGAGYFGRVADPRLDPRPFINNARAGKFNTGSPSGLGGVFQNLAYSGVGQNYSTTAYQVRETLNNFPGFEGLVEALDIVETFQPFKLQNDNGILGQLPGIGDIINTMTLPADAMQALLVFVTSNMMAALVRGMIIFLGIAILLALIKNAINQATIDVTGQSPGQLIGTAASVAPALAALA
jgi:hypothetical protein